MSFDLPALPDGWEFIPSESCAVPGSISYGVVQPGAPVSIGIPIVRVNNFQDGGLDLSDVLRVAPEVEAKHARTRLRGGEVLLTLVGSVGQVAEVPSQCAGFNVARAVGVVRPANGFEGKWLAICLRSPLSQFLLGSRANTTVQTTINLKDVRALPVPMPPARERVQIIEMIGALDDRITLLRETNATLEAIAQALFKSWFVDFDPVRAKSQGLAPAGMDEDTVALFPDGFEALGQIPAGWRAGTLAECAWLNSLSWSTRTHPGRVWYLDLANVKNNELASMHDIAFEDAPSRARRALRDGDTIVGTVRPGNRSFAYIDDPIAGMTASTGFAVLTPKTPELTAFTYLASTNDISIEHLAHVADGGAYPAVRPEVVSALPCVLPTAEVLRLFDSAARPMLQKIASHQRQAQSLSALRDTLLPRLISGQLRLPEAEALLEEATA